jgi:hypothetical protein
VPLDVGDVRRWTRARHIIRCERGALLDAARRDVECGQGALLGAKDLYFWVQRPTPLGGDEVWTCARMMRVVEQAVGGQGGRERCRERRERKAKSVW